MFRDKFVVFLHFLFRILKYIRKKTYQAYKINKYFKKDKTSSATPTIVNLLTDIQNIKGETKKTDTFIYKFSYISVHHCSLNFCTVLFSTLSTSMLSNLLFNFVWYK